MHNPAIKTLTKNNLGIGQFSAMACPCEILVNSTDEKLVQHLTTLAYNEAKRIEKKFSRYRNDNIIFQINCFCLC